MEKQLRALSLNAEKRSFRYHLSSNEVCPKPACFCRLCIGQLTTAPNHSVQWLQTSGNTWLLCPSQGL
jgi:hypothetical protein